MQDVQNQPDELNAGRDIDDLTVMEATFLNIICFVRWARQRYELLLWPQEKSGGLKSYEALAVGGVDLGGYPHAQHGYAGGPQRCQDGRGCFGVGAQGSMLVIQEAFTEPVENTTACWRRAQVVVATIEGIMVKCNQEGC